jgi:hypothetical protein
MKTTKVRVYYYNENCLNRAQIAGTILNESVGTVGLKCEDGRGANGEMDYMCVFCDSIVTEPRHVHNNKFNCLDSNNESLTEQLGFALGDCSYIEVNKNRRSLYKAIDTLWQKKEEASYWYHRAVAHNLILELQNILRSL